MKKNELFQERYKALNKAQKQAVDALEGPVMVVAGPGTGKTEILTLRIANILKKTDTPPSGILALTFTNSGVMAMRERLLRMIGGEAGGVVISTFHSFGISLISEFYEELNFALPPRLLDDSDRVILFDELLENNPWQYLRGRSGGAHNFNDLKSVISLLKQEKISPKDFLQEIENDIERIKNDPESFSSRGKTKGELKATEQEKIERFERTREIANFYDLYEKTKLERLVADYDDILEYIVRLVRRSENARATIRERYLYVLVDEHQDSTGVQNDFIEAVWGDVEKPNVFVVGDDRQLIYGFGGASLSHFERFQKIFTGFELIALTENYRSTQKILDVADALLESSITPVKLQSTRDDNYPVSLIQAEFPRDEILLAALEIKKKIGEGVPEKECALLVPKNSQVKSATAVLADLGLKVASGGKVSFFSLSHTQSLIRYLKAASDPFSPDKLANILLDPAFEVPFLVSQKFLRDKGHKLSLDDFKSGDESIVRAGEMVESLAEEIHQKDVYQIIQTASQELFFGRAKTNAVLTLEVEVVRTMLHLSLGAMEKNRELTLVDFIVFLSRLEDYGQDISLAVFEGEEGVQVKTLHASKGLEFDFVWIAHLDEGSLMKGKQLAVTLPEKIKSKVVQKDIITAKRELYVGITRAKRFCTLSYSKNGYSGVTQQLAKIISEMSDEFFEKVTASETEGKLRSESEFIYVESNRKPPSENTRLEITNLVKDHYRDRPLSVTHLNNFFSCTWKWYFRNFLLLPEPVTESLEFGNLIHRTIEVILKNNELGSVDSLLESIMDEERIYNERKRQRFLTEGREVIRRFEEKYFPIFKGAESEKKPSSFRDPDIPEVEVTGKIDVLKYESDKSLSVTDFKTGKVKTKSEIERMTKEGRMSDLLRQLAMYSYLIINDKFSLNGRRRVSKSRLLFLEAEDGDKNAIYETEITQKEIGLLKKDIHDFVKLVSTGEWIDCPCDFKVYGNQKICEYCEFARNLNLKS